MAKGGRTPRPEAGACSALSSRQARLQRRTRGYRRQGTQRRGS
jgi:hypothetical protein